MVLYNILYNKYTFSVVQLHYRFIYIFNRAVDTEIFSFGFMVSNMLGLCPSLCGVKDVGLPKPSAVWPWSEN